MFKKFLIASVLLLPMTAHAQQADQAFMQHAIGALQAQRNAAQDAQAGSEAKLAGVTEDLNKANQKIKELEDKYEPKKADTKPEAKK